MFASVSLPAFLLSALLIPSLTTAAIDPQLIHVADITFNIGQSQPQNLTTGSFVYVPIESGSFNTTSSAPSPHLRTTILPGGSDYAQIASDNSYRLDVRTAANGTAGEGLFYLESYGYVAPDAVADPSQPAPEFGTVDAWQTMRVSTQARGFEWLNGAALVGQEVPRPGEGRVDLRVWWVRVKP